MTPRIPVAGDAVQSGEAEEAWLLNMKYAEPQYSKRRVNDAGALLVVGNPDPVEYADALEVINNWRASHHFPLNTFQVGLKSRARRIDADAVVAQRIKRLSSIEAKLRRFQTMTLSQMQDIGGCRAIMTSLGDVKRLVHAYYASEIKHKLHQCDDYIDAPKDSGYRGIHLIYKYHSDKKQTYNSLKIEIQIRSHLQHAWSTAVETVGTFVRQALKSSQGEEEWLRFFALMGTALAQREGTARVPNTPARHQELVIELREHVRRLDVTQRLRAYGAALNILEDHGLASDRYFLLELLPAERVVRVRGFKANQSEEAAAAYLETEKSIQGKPGADAVLVSVESIATLRRAYPNYFLDTHVFLNLVEEAVRSLRPRRTIIGRQAG